VNWRTITIYLLGGMFILAGFSSLAEGIGGFVGGILMLVSGLFLLPQTRSPLLGYLDSRTELNLSGVGATVIILLALLGGGAGAMLIPTDEPAPETDSTVAETETPTAVLTQSSTSTPTSTATPTLTATSTLTVTPTPQPTTESGSQTAWTVTVVDVVDGDTMDVRLPNGSVETVRLLGVDTPETSVTQVSPDEWEGVPDTTDGRDWLANWGDDASQYAEDRLAGKEVYIEVDSEADRRGYYGRLLVYVYQSESSEISFNERLLTNGYARYYDSTFSEQDAYQDAEDTARDQNVGVWDYTAPETTPTDAGGSGSGSGSVIVADIHEDAEGNDNENLNDEYVIFENTGDEAVEMTGWTVSDEADHVYSFPSGFTLEPGDSVTLYTGSGTDTDDELYWGENGAVWNNGGDTVTLKDENGDTVDTYTY
jgi:micrococcal nuclease